MHSVQVNYLNKALQRFDSREVVPSCDAILSKLSYATSADCN